MEPKARSPESVVREIKRKTCRTFNPEERIRIILEGLKGEDSIAANCRRGGIAPSLHYKWSKSFLKVGKKRLKGDKTREANSVMRSRSFAKKTNSSNSWWWN
jgi:transposase-like protein